MGIQLFCFAGLGLRWASASIMSAMSIEHWIGVERLLLHICDLWWYLIPNNAYS